MSRLVLIGAGPIGIDAARECVALGVADAVAAVADTDPAARAAASEAFGCPVVADAADLPELDTTGVALLAFSSSAEATAAVAAAMLEREWHVVTTCEELSDPSRPECDRLDRAARLVRRAVVATGANPGFAMDGFPLAIARGSVDISAVRVTRRVDTSTRREQLVAKTGRGCTEPAFRSQAARGELGHVGLGASARLLAAGLGWRLGELDELIEPVLAGDDSVAGLHQRVKGSDASGRMVSLDLVMAWELGGTVDRVEIEGFPSLVAEIVGGYPGDEGTTARVVRAVGACHTLEPGLHLAGGGLIP